MEGRRKRRPFLYPDHIEQSDTPLERSRKPPADPGHFIVARSRSVPAASNILSKTEWRGLSAPGLIPGPFWFQNSPMAHPSPLARADDLLAAGRTVDAIALVRTAAASGDVDALFRLAVWHLIGTPLPRDLIAARQFLRDAVAIGHVDAALMEIALTANGGGGAPDWPAALSLLRIAAAGDPVAARQLALVDAMSLGPDGAPATPPAARILSARPDVRLFATLFTPDECRHVATVGNGLLEPAMVVDPGTGRLVHHPIRTSDGGVIGPAQEDLVIHALNRRIATASGTGHDQGEPLMVLRYAPGQQYRAHLDALPRAANQRILTALVYLNTGYRGGETRFLANGLSVTGRTGDMLLFRNVDTDGQPDPASRHAGLPVTAGHKWLATRWIRADRHDPWARSTV